WLPHCAWRKGPFKGLGKLRNRGRRLWCTGRFCCLPYPGANVASKADMTPRFTPRREQELFFHPL
ncbi:hypothetical protein M9458_007609, partial [Cirrhinus mrigala]